jgi:hypothetical protein
MFSWIIRMRRPQNLCNNFEGPQKTSIATMITLMPTIETSHQSIQITHRQYMRGGCTGAPIFDETFTYVSTKCKESPNCK